MRCESHNLFLLNTCIVIYSDATQKDFTGGVRIAHKNMYYGSFKRLKLKSK